MKKIEEKMDQLNLIRKSTLQEINKNPKLKQNLFDDIYLIETFPDKVME